MTLWPSCHKILSVLFQVTTINFTSTKDKISEPNESSKMLDDRVRNKKQIYREKGRGGRDKYVKKEKGTKHISEEREKDNLRKMNTTVDMKNVVKEMKLENSDGTKNIGRHSRNDCKRGEGEATEIQRAIVKSSEDRGPYRERTGHRMKSRGRGYQERRGFESSINLASKVEHRDPGDSKFNLYVNCKNNGFIENGRSNDFRKEWVGRPLSGRGRACRGRGKYKGFRDGSSISLRIDKDKENKSQEINNSIDARLPPASPSSTINNHIKDVKPNSDFNDIVKCKQIHDGRPSPSSKSAPPGFDDFR